MSEGISLSQLSSRVASLIGPFAITFETPGIGSSEDGALLTELPSGVIVVQHMIVTEEAWGGGNGTGIFIYLGGPDFGPPDDDFGALGSAYAVANLNPGGGNGYDLGLSQSCFGTLTAGGALVAQGIGNFTTGASSVYAIILSPGS